MEFDFIHDKKFRAILERDYQEIERCIEAQASKSILILCGSIVETVLSDYFIEHLPSNKSKADILRESLAGLLDLAEAVKLISAKDKSLSEVIREYRNLIHPGKEIRANEDFDFDTAQLSKTLLDILLKKIRTKHLQTFEYKSSDIIEKLINDWGFHSIYELAIARLDHSEREKLLRKLIEMEVLFKSGFEHYMLLSDYDPKDEINKLGELGDAKTKVQALKPLIKSEVILEILGELKNAVVKGENIIALSLYNLFHEELHLLSKSDQEIIAVYALNLNESVYENSRELARERTYSTIGNYLDSESGLKSFKTFTQSRIVNSSGGEDEGEIYQQMFNSLTTIAQQEVKEDLFKFLPESREKLDAHWIAGFYDELVRRKIIKDKYRID